MPRSNCPLTVIEVTGLRCLDGIADACRACNVKVALKVSCSQGRFGMSRTLVTGRWSGAAGTPVEREIQSSIDHIRLHS